MLGLIRVQWVRGRRTHFWTWGANGPSQLPLPRPVQEVPALLPPTHCSKSSLPLHVITPLLLRILRVVSWVWSLVYGWEAAQACLGCPCLWLWLLPGTWGPSQLKLVPCSPPTHRYRSPVPPAEEDNYLGWFCVEDDGNQMRKERHPLLMGHVPVTVAKQQEFKVPCHLKGARCCSGTSGPTHVMTHVIHVTVVTFLHVPELPKSLPRALHSPEAPIDIQNSRDLKACARPLLYVPCLPVPHFCV